MPVAEIIVKSKNGGYFYTKKNLDKNTINIILEKLSKNKTHKLELSPYEHVSFGDINVKIEEGTLLEYCFYGINPDGIILGIDLFNEILKFNDIPIIEAQLKEINPNVNLEMLHLLQDITHHITADDQENKKIFNSPVFKGPNSPINVDKIVGKIESLKTIPLLAKVRDSITENKVKDNEVCADAICINEKQNNINKVPDNILNINTTNLIETSNRTLKELIIEESKISSKSSLNSPDSRRSSNHSIHSDLNDLSESIITKFGEIRHNISEAKLNLVDIENQNISGNKYKIGSLISKHTNELNEYLNGISNSLDDLNKQIELESNATQINKIDLELGNRKKIQPKKNYHSRALLETRGLINNTGKITSKPKL